MKYLNNLRRGVKLKLLFGFAVAIVFACNEISINSDN